MAWSGGGSIVGMGAVNGQVGSGVGLQPSATGGRALAEMPAEFADRVARLVAREPDHGESSVVFSHRVSDDRRLTLRRLVRPCRPLALCAAALVVIEALILQAGPFLTQVGIDDGIAARSWSTLLVVGGLFVGLVMLSVAAGRARIALAGRIAADVMYELRLRVFAHLQRLSLNFYTDEKAGVVMTRMTSDIENLQQLLSDGFALLAIHGLSLVVVVLVLFRYNVALALTTVAIVVPAMAALSLWFRAASRREFGRVRDRIAAVLSHLSESLAGVRVASGFNRHLRNIVHHRDVTGAYRDANDGAALLTAIYGPSGELVGIIGQVAVLLVGSTMVRDGSLTVGQLAAFILYLNALFLPIQHLVQQYNVYQQAQASMFKLRELLATQPSVAERADAGALPPIAGDVLLDGVTFGYDAAHPVLRDVSLHVAAGETVCLVGPTGAGKSTIASLIARHYDPDSGRVLIDGHDLRVVTLTSLRRQLGIVPQEVFLFAGTVRDNLLFTHPEISERELRQAIEHLGLEELIGRLPNGLDTVVHERGVSLSSGERQLLAIGRAFLARPRILVLDEATSNLDSESEARIEAALAALFERRTAIIIAHRLSTARRADRIAVVDGGRIVETGSHDQLVASGGQYAGMYARWLTNTTVEVAH